MKIFYDHQIFSLQDAGGASRYFYELARHLRGKDDLHLEIATGLNNSVYPFENIVDEHTHVFEKRSSLKPGVPRYLLNELISNAVGLARGRFDIYHPTLYRALPFLRCRRIAVTHHDCIHERFPHLFRNAATVIRNKRRLYASADAIICVSESSRRDLLRFYPVEERRTHVIYHGFAPFAEAEGNDVLPRSVPSQYILFVGARGAYKNFIALLEAYKASAVAFDYELVAVGGGEFSAIESAKIKQLGIADRVTLIPRASDEMLAAMYRNAALFVYPSLYEGFGFPPLEAMSVGCPVLTANTSSMPEICGEAAFYFDPEAPGALETALQRVLTDCKGLAEMKERGHRQVSQYHWELTASQTLQVYQNLVEG